MKLAWRQRWDVTPGEAREIQNEVRRRVILTDDPAVSFSISNFKSQISNPQAGGADEGVRAPSVPPHSAFNIPHSAFPLPPRLVAADVGYDKESNLCFASVVEWDTAEKKELAHWTHVQPATFPYVPGLLSFREIPALLPIFETLPFTPELVVCDGQGIAHPRRVGLASHLGVVLGCPTLGWAKTRLIGTYEEPPVEGGEATPLRIGKEQVGWVLRSRTGVKPTFVSPGHRVSVEGALGLARALLGRYRLCDPARRAHELTRVMLQEYRAGRQGKQEQ